MVELWKEDLTKVNTKAAESLADPAEYPNLFPDFDLGLMAEHQAQQTKSQRIPVCYCILCQFVEEQNSWKSAKKQSCPFAEKTSLQKPAGHRPVVSDPNGAR